MSHRTLHQEIQAQITLGVEDPHEIANRVIAAMTPNRLATELVLNARQIIATLARMKIGEDRRRAVVQVPPYVPGMTRIERYGGGWESLLEQRVFVPGVGWRLHRDLTAADCRAVADDRREEAAKNLAWASRYDNFADDIEAAGVETLGDLPNSETEVA